MSGWPDERITLLDLHLSLWSRRSGALCVSLVSVFSYSVFRLVFGTLYPAYSSYKAVKSRDLKEYVSTCACIFSRWQRHRVKVSLTVSISGSDPSGEMDDVLDNLCPVHDCGSIHRHVPSLVSAALSPLH